MILSPARLRALLTALLLVSLLGALDHTIVASSLATVAGELGGLEQMSWMIVAYTLASTVAMPVFGRLGDLYGRRGLFLTSLAVFLVGSVLCGFTQDMTQLAGARVFQGIGGAGVQLLSQTIIADVVAPRQRAKYQGIIGAAFPIAIVIGPLAGGLITDSVGWRWIFWVNAPLGLLALLLAVRNIPKTGRSAAAGTFDVPGAVLLGIATTGLVLAVTWGGSLLSWTSPALLAIVAVTVLSSIAFFVVEARAEHPLVPLGIFRSRVVVIATILASVVGIGLFSVVSYLPAYIQMMYRTTATVAGLVPVASVLGMLVTSLLSGFVVARSGRYRIFPILGTAAGAAGLAGMSLITDHVPLWLPMGLMAVVGLGTGAFMQLVVVIVQGVTDQSALGAVTSAVNVVRQIGSTVATAVVGGVFALRLVEGLPGTVDARTLTPNLLHTLPSATQAQVADAYSSAMSPIFLALAAVYAVGFVAALLLPHTELSNELQHTPAESEALSI
ncbi:MFS transporter [Naasia aerilata]|uniref:MFS transporter n=1 Tax=Naasia aerilata TaxID=1162966 RepID=A0ABM8G8F3_9MICO|nr:MFS transporter [Naasia aerilata]BDZ44468.1 MFS transporter [Naasia aerilata]